MSSEVCEINLVNKKDVAFVRKRMLSDESVCQVVDTFGMFSDHTRLKILYALSVKELCVCDIACLLGISQSAASHQLRVLRQAKFVKYKKKGKIVYYSIIDDHVKTLIDSALDHSKH